MYNGYDLCIFPADATANKLETALSRDHWLVWPHCDSLFFMYMREKLVAVYMYNRLLYVIHVYLSTVCVLF